MPVMPHLALVLVALLLLPGGWLASAWFYRRKLQALQMQLKVVRKTAAVHADQARRQIGQLQAELAARASRPVPGPRRGASQPPPPRPAPVPAAIAEPEPPAHGFAATAILEPGVRV